MRNRRQSQGFLMDGSAQALTEFALIIPVILLMFFAIIQYLMVVQTSQLAAYASYAALRAYVVNVDGGSDADEKAKLAAAMVLSPVSYPFPGEAEAHAGLGIGQYMKTVLTDFGLSASYANKVYAMLAGKTSLGGIESLDGVPAPIMKTGIAWGRLGFFGRRELELYGPPKKLSGGNPNLPQRTLILRYDLPTWLPGFREMWNFVEGDTMEETFAGRIGIYPTIEVASICTMGLESWGGTLMMPATEDASTAGDSPLGEMSADLQEQQAKFDAALEKMKEASSNYDAAKNEYNECLSTAEKASDCNGEKSTMDYWASQKEYWSDQAQAAQDEMERIREDIGNYGDSLEK